MASTSEIDDSLYSRQRYVLGDTAMQRMAKSNVFLSGIGGLGVEIAKNLILAGVKSLTLHDSKMASFMDLGAQFYLTEDHVKLGENRAKASLSKLAELNPYVSVNSMDVPLSHDSDLNFLSKFQCVVLTEVPLAMQIKVNEYCRSQDPQIKFISADVRGVFCWSFVDFGDNFEVLDTNGEEPKEIFVSMITKDNPGVVSTMESLMHGLEDGDIVTFKEVNGMTEVNNVEFNVKVLTPHKFSIGDTSGFSTYENGGILKQIKKPAVMQFKSLEDQLKAPDYLCPDLCKFEAPMNIHVGLLALDEFCKYNARVPSVNHMKDAEAMQILAKEANEKLESPLENIDYDVINRLSMTSEGCLAPLCAYLGGTVAQEALKAVTGKFSPLKQWLHLDAIEVMPSDNLPIEQFMPRMDRYDSLRVCVGQPLCEELAKLNLFMVGCGAIGCEMMKNYALLGIASSPQGQITITDNDLIEKSNLNRQFLFRNHHIRKPKSTTAAESTQEINSQLNIIAHQHKVCPQTEATVYTDNFFTRQDIVVNALDNLEARLYMDSRCVTNQRALLESGTMGAKGHVQVIVPHLTESYNSQRDPVEHSVPFCTLKSFPAQIEHCIQWARSKFESSFAQKPALYSKFWSTHSSTDQVLQNLGDGNHMDGCVQVSKLCASRPHNFKDCVALARSKFEKYFNHKAKHLLHAFPLDTKTSDGALFWQSPKRPPVPIEFDASNEQHLSFIRACARLYADIAGVQYTYADLDASTLKQQLISVQVPQFRPTSKKIETDEAVTKEEGQEEEIQADDVQQAAHRIQHVLQTHGADAVIKSMQPLNFEKDDDGNSHVDFITATSNLRAEMYRIEPADRLQTKRIAGRIVPAIATTTGAVAGLVAVELLKIVKKCSLDQYKNAFMNLALPLYVLSEPGAVQKTVLSNGSSFSDWDRWEIQGNKDMTLAQFMQEIMLRYKLEPSMVVQGNKMVYVPLMPMHKKRLPQTMVKLLKPVAGKTYADLVVSYQPPAGEDEDEMGPSVRYYFNA